LPESVPTISQTTDIVWARPFLTDLLSKWRSSISTHEGLFRPQFSRTWDAVDSSQPVILVSQCRLIYTMSVGYQLTGEQQYFDVASQGLESFEKYFRIGNDAHYCWSVLQDGSHDVPDVNAYGYAFIILAQATAAAALSRPELARQALETWQYMHRTLTDEYGGLRWHRPVARPDIPEEAQSQNPMMHAFEALMALVRCKNAPSDVTKEALDAARTIHQFMTCLECFGDGSLVEWYTADWHRQSVEQGGFLDLGHAFEWAYLLSEWHALTGDTDALDNGHRFLKMAMALGLNDDGSVNALANPDGTVTSTTHGLWQQCEAVRAVYRYAAVHVDTETMTALPKVIEYYKAHFVDPDFGGVFAGPVVDGELKSMHKGDSWKLDYHSTNMLLELGK